MQSQKLFSYLVLSVFFFMGTGCNDFLDVPTRSDVSIATTADDYRDMLYPLDLTWVADPIIAVMGDEVYWSKDFYDYKAVDETYRRAYLWKDEIYDVALSSTQWNTQYSLIYTYNKIIDEVRYIQGDNLLEIEAEARVYRALCYFYLVNTYAQPYAMTSETDPGVPVILKNDIEERNRQRTPVKEVYKFILADLDSALKYLPDYAPNPSRYQASKIGALGLKARTFFQMNQYDNVKTTLEELLSILANKTSPHGYRYAFLDFNEGMLPWSAMDSEGDIETIMANEYMTDPTKGYYMWGAMNPVLASDHLLDVFSRSPNDMRKELMLYATNASTDEPDRIVKTGSYSNTGVVLSDVYLMLAESYARDKNTSKALHYLNELRKNRIAADSYADLSSSDANQILRWVLEERMREFIATGHRWLDMRRLWDDPIGGSMINKTRTLEGKTYTLTKERLAVRVPSYIMQFHPDWQNP